MKLTILLLVAVFRLSAIGLAQDATKAANLPGTQKDAPAVPDGNRLKPGQEELEAKFKETLNKATMSGRWCSLKEGVLGPEKQDKYTIVNVNKLNGDAWVINARIQYGKIDVVAPIPVQVKWAGDAAVIIVDQLALPGGGTYSARVLIYNHTYAGTWSGGDHGGLLNGVITNETEGKPAEAR